MIITIFIVIAFVRQAGELGLKKLTWGLIGFAAYFVSQLLFGVVAFMVVELLGAGGGSIDDSPGLVMNLLGIGVGGVVAYIAYQQMPKYAEKENTARENDLLDDDMFR
jgi:hypothetical protein